MTTVLNRPLSREVILDGAPFKVVISPEGIRLNRKGRRRGAEIGWDSILALGESTSPGRAPTTQSPHSDLPEPIAADAAKQIRAARDALTRASEALERAGDLPRAVLNMIEPDPVYGRVTHDSDWFIEPLLTSDELAAIFRLSKRRVSDLPIPSLIVGSERRYRQSEVRRFISNAETQDGAAIKWR